MQSPEHRLVRAILTLGLAIGAASAAGCGSANGTDASPIPSTGVAEAAKGARGVTVPDQRGSGTDPLSDPLGDGAPAPLIPPPQPVPAPLPADPFGPPITPPGTPLPPPPPQPPSTGVPM